MFFHCLSFHFIFFLFLFLSFSFSFLLFSFFVFLYYCFFWASISLRFLFTFLQKKFSIFRPVSGGTPLRPLFPFLLPLFFPPFFPSFFFFLDLVLLFFFLFFLVFLSNIFNCWRYYQSLTVSSVVGAPWRCGRLDDIGRDSWDWVGPPAWERACFNSPEWGGGSSPVKTEPLQIVLFLLLFWTL